MKFILFFIILNFSIFSKQAIDLPFYDLSAERFTIHGEITKLNKPKSGKKEILSRSGDMGEGTKPKLIIINFTSSTCEPCKKEIPELLNLRETFQSKGLELWIIFIGDTNKDILAKVEELKIPKDVKVYKDPLSISFRRLGISGVPFTYLLDLNKEVIHSESGYNEKKFEAFKKIIEAGL